MNKDLDKINHNNSFPTICLDLKQYRIRIYKSTLKELNNPKTINIMVNPSSKIIAIKNCPDTDQYAIKIYPSQLMPDNCCEIHSNSLLSKLYTLCPNLQLGKSYRIYGYKVSNTTFIYFNLESAEQINDEVEL